MEAIKPAKIFELVCSCSGLTAKTLMNGNGEYKYKLHAMQALCYMLKKYSKLTTAEIHDLTGFTGEKICRYVQKVAKINHHEDLTKPGIVLTLEIEKYLEPI